MALTQVQTQMLGTGAVLQVVQGLSTTQTSTTGGTYVASPITATITPKFATSKILILSTYYVRSSIQQVSIVQTFYRNSTAVESASYGINYWYTTATGFEATTSTSWLDSPATTSATTYTLYFKRADSAGTVYVGNTNNTSTIQLLEIAG